MIKDYQISIASITPSEQLCLDAVVSSTSTWLDSVVDAQIAFGRMGIIAALKEYCFANGVAPAATDDEKVMQAFELGIVKTAAQVAEEFAAEQAAQGA